MSSQDYGSAPRKGEERLLPGEELLAALHSLLQNVKFHREDNILVVKCIQRLREAARRCSAESGEVTIQIAKGKFFINEEKLPYRRNLTFLVDKMMRILEDRGVMGLRFYPALLVAPAGELAVFAGLLNGAIRRKNPMDWLVLQLEEEKLQWVALLQPEVLATDDISAGLGRRQVQLGRAATGSGAGGCDGQAAGEEKDSSSAAGGTGRGGEEVPGGRSPRRLYAYALEAMREVAGKISGNRRSGIRNAVRIVQNMAEEISIQEQPLLLAMSTIRVYDDYTFSHSVNVAILAMFLGKKIGVSKETLECLGICGLFHDLGKVLIPLSVFAKEEPLTAAEMIEIRQHSLNSTRLILRLRASAKRKAGILIPTLEHHLGLDLKGYPQIGWQHSPTLCGRILAICDCFDALTSPRIYRHDSYSADKALGVMLEQAGTIFDPLLLKVFINTLGVYPIGTLLELDNGDIGLVCRSPETEDMARPLVLLLIPDGKGGFVKGEEVDLAEKDQAGFYFREVSGSANPALFNIQPAEFLT